MTAIEKAIIYKIAINIFEEATILLPEVSAEDSTVAITLQNILELAERNKICTRYRRFDLEATQRERDAYRKLLEADKT